MWPTYSQVVNALCMSSGTYIVTYTLGLLYSLVMAANVFRPVPRPQYDTRILVRADRETKARWAQFAASLNIPLSELIRNCVDSCIEQAQKRNKTANGGNKV